MIHDFATAPRQTDWRNNHKGRELKSDKKGKNNEGNSKRILLSVVAVSVLVVFGQWAFFSGEPQLDQQPDEAAKQEYLESVLLEEGTQAGANDDFALDVDTRETAAPEKSSASRVELEQPVQLNAKKEIAKTEEVIPEPVIDPDYEFYDTLTQGSWPVPINKGVYVDGELTDRERPVYSLQAASFRNKDDAYRLVQKLKQRKLKAVVLKSVSSNGLYWYQVSVGPFVSTTKLNKAQDILVSMNMMPLKKRVR